MEKAKPAKPSSRSSLYTCGHESRAFVSTSGAALTGSSLTPRRPPRRLPKLMKLGCQALQCETHLKYFRAIRRPVTSAGIRRFRAASMRRSMNPRRCAIRPTRTESATIAAPPSLPPAIDKEKHPAIMLAQARSGTAISSVQTLIRNRRRGSPVHQIQHEHSGVLRGRDAPRARRRDLQHVEFEKRPSGNAPDARRATADMAWERITYFLEKVNGAADIRCGWRHLHDPGSAGRATRRHALLARWTA